MAQKIMEVKKISKQNRKVVGEITLTGSKSICNRALVIRAFSKQNYPIYGIAAAKDTQTLIELLNQDGDVYDAGPAGTTFRFMTAYLAMQDGTQILTGSERMKQRPIGVLVEALKSVGANIEYLEKEGYPPLKIHAPSGDFGKNNKIFIPANVSSQYISALLMAGPTLPNGLELHLMGKIVSRPYIQMTLNLMAYFGIQYQWNDNVISVPSQTYEAREFTVEADWSAASYYYIIAAFSDECDLQLNGLFEESVQGDAVLQDMMTHFGVVSTFNEKGGRLTRAAGSQETFVYNFLECPDIAQSLAVVCGGLNVNGHFSGLETLKIKETDRVAALNIELAKVGVAFEEQTDGSCKVSGQAQTSANVPTFATYEDHRMAMAFAPLAMLVEKVQIEAPDVVVKSYPDYWNDLASLGFEY
jgi:3-phosphoshikimate 1-carboxyvinyltransferase